MAKILCIDTSTNICSISFGVDGRLAAFEEIADIKSHATKITLLIQSVLDKANVSIQELDAVCVSKGPGSYTGLRIGVSVAKGICFASDIKLIAIDTLQSLANHYIETVELDDNALVCPMIDARRMEVYTSLFDQSLNCLMPTNALVIDNDSFVEYLNDNKIYFVGNGAEKTMDIINHKNSSFDTAFNLSSRGMISLSEQLFNDQQFEDVAYFEPFYLKEFVAIKSSKNIFRTS